MFKRIGLTLKRLVGLSERKKPEKSPQKGSYSLSAVEPMQPVSKFTAVEFPLIPGQKA